MLAKQNDILGAKAQLFVVTFTLTSKNMVPKWMNQRAT